MVIIDSNVLLDIITDDEHWFAWSSEQLVSCAADGLAINPVIYAELCPGFTEPGPLDRTLDELGLKRLDLPYEAAFKASLAFLEYRKKGGERTRPLPDFFIGAQALVGGFRLLTRDPARYRSYFPGLALICPD